MARRQEDVKIDDESSRDFGKTYVVTEMDADRGEWWAFRVLQAILGGSNGDDLKLIDFKAPLAELAPIAIKMGLTALSNLPPDKAKSILDEMMSCVSVRMPDNTIRSTLPSDIEEIATRIKLRGVMLEMHTSFFSTGIGSISV